MAVAIEPATFAERLRELREAAGMSQYELAQRSGLTRQAVSAFEKGDREPSWESVQKLAEGLGVSVVAFIVKKESAAEEQPEAPARPMGKRK